MILAYIMPPAYLQRDERCKIQAFDPAQPGLPRKKGRAATLTHDDKRHGITTRAAAEAALDTFTEKYGTTYEKAVTCLSKDREALLAHYAFPSEHRDHPRTGNPIESVFATVRHRTVRTKCALSQKTAKLMVFKPVQSAAKTWRRLKGANQLPKVIAGVTFTDGVAPRATETRAAWSGRVAQIEA